MPGSGRLLVWRRRRIARGDVVGDRRAAAPVASEHAPRTAERAGAVLYGPPRSVQVYHRRGEKCHCRSDTRHARAVRWRSPWAGRERRNDTTPARPEGKGRLISPLSSCRRRRSSHFSSLALVLPSGMREGATDPLRRPSARPPPASSPPLPYSSHGAMISAKEFRARLRRDFTVPRLQSVISAISSYDLPSSSRRTKTWR